MNADQELAIDIALSGHNLLLLGAAGTGKSYVIREIYKSLKAKGKNVQITCSTGIACNVYRGQGEACTIHQFAGLSDGRYGPEDIVNVIKNNRNYDYVVQNIKNVDCVIVDECSMISLRTFHTIEQVCKIKDPCSLWGGIQVIFCGDFFQLPPVPNKHYGDDGKYCFESKNFAEVFPHRIVLHENLRQKDEKLIKAITEVYSGNLSTESEDFITSLSAPLQLSNGIESVKLYSRNDLVDDYNRKCILKYPGNLYEFRSTDTGSTTDLLHITAPHVLWLKKGCPVILLRNLSNLLVNGLTGNIEELDNQGILVHFSSLNMTTRIPRVKFSVFSPKFNTDIAVREQYPLKLGFGLTIHKAQGMTLTNVEVDCREIFKAGQLGVALSRATSTCGLRVINFHCRYVMKPPQTVIQCMNEHSIPITADVLCCKFTKSSSAEEDHMCTQRGNTDDHQYSNIEPLELDDLLMDDLDDDFNELIATLISDEAETIDFDIPEGYDTENVLNEMIFKKEITNIHTEINKIIRNIDKVKLQTFVKKLFLKMAIFAAKLKGGKGEGTAIPEKNVVQFYRSVHDFSTSDEYRMNCLILFENEKILSDNHMIICFNILSSIRLFYLKQKADSMKITSGRVIRRHVTNASRARIRYVAGYCIAKLRKKFLKKQKTNRFVNTTKGRNDYNEAKCAVNILSVLKETEYFLQTNTNEPESLIDVERRQYNSHGLTNITDKLFLFFVNLTQKVLNMLIYENLMKFGEQLMAHCIQILNNDSDMYNQFITVITERLRTEPMEEFDDIFNVTDIMNNMVLCSVQICKLYTEKVKKNFMVFLSQFRKDFKSSLKVEKTMAHRKQIKVRNQVEEKGKSLKRKSTVKTSNETYESCENEMDTNQCAPSSPAKIPRNETNLQNEPQPGPSTDTKEVHMDDDNSELCRKCLTDRNDEWIQCDSCDLWWHRKCAGLRNAKKWKKLCQEGNKWFCNDCK